MVSGIGEGGKTEPIPNIVLDLNVIFPNQNVRHMNIEGYLLKV